MVIAAGGFKGQVEQLGAVQVLMGGHGLIATRQVLVEMLAGNCQVEHLEDG